MESSADHYTDIYKSVAVAGTLFSYFGLLWCARAATQLRHYTYFLEIDSESRKPKSQETWRTCELEQTAN
ncbi:hypothetical protein BDR03DRAFT_508546 [Suillus americanus]|nr:hypothetical protein BDR03DRAFT_508546 [Suillus americanus]